MYQKHGHFHDGDSGLDVFITKDQIIKSGETAILRLGIACENLDKKSFLLMARSSISKTPIRLSNSIGLIDAGYRGEIMASVDNIKNIDYEVKVGQRLFQIVSMDGEPVKFRLDDNLSATNRGNDGFGSTDS